MEIDREYQRELLIDLRTRYPDHLCLKDAQGDAATNCLYLQEHGLVVCSSYATEQGLLVSSARITAKGLDFLEEDGGMTAILGVVKVDLHENTIRALIEARIDSSDLAESEKQEAIHQLRALRGSGLAHLTNRLIDLGLDQFPAALTAIRTGLSL